MEIKDMLYEINESVTNKELKSKYNNKVAELIILINKISNLRNEIDKLDKKEIKNDN